MNTHENLQCWMIPMCNVSTISTHHGENSNDYMLISNIKFFSGASGSSNNKHFLFTSDRKRWSFLVTGNWHLETFAPPLPPLQ
jgi:hypothetical protein